jgi:formate hydrogenlyase subunit 6/NADH:ubiquinone oxidoreductase subunit I
MKVFPMARIALRNLFSKPATRRYPFVVREPFAASRGRITICFDDCILCGSCQRHCPAQAIEVERGAGRWKIDRFSCVNCGACVEACPKKCLKLENERAKVADFADLAARQEEHIRPVEPKPAPVAAPEPLAPSSAPAGASPSHA